MKKIQIELKEEVHTEFKSKCAAQKATMQDKITELIQVWLNLET